MRYNFVKFGITSGLNLDERDKDYFFYSENKEKFNQIFEFLSGNKSCFVLSGFQGAGKSKIANKAISYLNSDVILFHYHMYQATTLDDILMNLTIDFRNYQKNSNTNLPKIDTKDFRERIQYYIKNLNKPILLLLESFENILKFQETSGPILDFLLHLATLDKFKVVFISRNFDTQIFKDNNIDFDKSIITSLEENTVRTYLTAQEITASNTSIEKLIANSGCYLKYIEMTTKLLQTFNIPLDDLMNEFELKKTTFSKFLINKFITLIPEKSKDIVFLLTILRQSTNAAFLSGINKYNANTINYLKNILILNDDCQGNFYIKDYFAKELEKELDQFSTLKLHSFFASYYDNMLPKKPFERELTISRNTMRRERDYHASFIENYNPSTQNQDTFSPNIQKISTTEEKNNSAITPDNIIKNYNLATKDISLPLSLNEPQLNTTTGVKDYKKTAEKYAKDFDYQSAIFYYKKTIEKTPENEIQTQKATILSQIAQCYIKLQDSEKAIKYFNLAFDLHTKNNQYKEANELLFEIALEHKNNYKFYLAKNYAEKILEDSKNTTPLLLSKTYNLLADIEDLSSNVTNAKELYKKALEAAKQTNISEILSMAYFKYGLLLDDTNQQTQAIECYQKCIEVCEIPEQNKYLSSAYSNLAGIFYEREEFKKSIEYYNKALTSDKKTDNNEGLYFVYSKLAAIYESTNKQESYKYLLNALQHAKKTADNIYIATAYIEIGDYYYNNKDNTQAIKAYLSAEHYLNNDIDEEVKQKIQTRLNDLKIKMGQNAFIQVVEKFEYKNEN